MDTLIIQRRTINIDGSAKVNLKWREKKRRLPRKKKKLMKKKYKIPYKFMMFGFSQKESI